MTRSRGSCESRSSEMAVCAPPDYIAIVPSRTSGCKGHCPRGRTALQPNLLSTHAAGQHVPFAIASKKSIRLLASSRESLYQEAVQETVCYMYYPVYFYLPSDLIWCTESVKSTSNQLQHCNTNQTSRKMTMAASEWFTRQHTILHNVCLKACASL